MDNFFFRRREVIEIGYETLVNFDRDMAAPPNIVQGFLYRCENIPPDRYEEILRC